MTATPVEIRRDIAEAMTRRARNAGLPLQVELAEFGLFQLYRTDIAGPRQPITGPMARTWIAIIIDGLIHGSGELGTQPGAVRLRTWSDDTPCTSCMSRQPHTHAEHRAALERWSEAQLAAKDGERVLGAGGVLQC